MKLFSPILRDNHFLPACQETAGILVRPHYKTFNASSQFPCLESRKSREFSGKNSSTKRTACIFFILAILFAGLLPARAQWLTQSFPLKSGWNGVYLHVDASHDTLDNLIKADANNPIMEVWLWAPPSTTLQFVQSPQKPTDTGSQWRCWIRNSSESATVQRLVGNAAYLVRVGTNVSTYTWNLKGKPQAPAYEWTTKGLNFLGFPSMTSGTASFDAYFAPAPELQQNAEIYQYPGGDLGDTNPQRVYALRTTIVNRGQACWIRAAETYNRYFAPFEVDLSNAKGLSFGDSLNTASFRLRNLTASNLTVSLRLLASETPPSGQPAVVDTPPLLIRGSQNLTNLTYSYTNLPVNASREWKLAPAGQEGSGVEVVLGLNRGSLNRNAGDLLAGVLRFTDSSSLAQVDVSVSATVGTSAGLWVGNAMATQVGEHLKNYARDGADNLVMDANGKYVVTRTNSELNTVAHPFTWRMIVHNPASGNAVLLQRAYVGPDAATNMIVANSESALNPAFLSQARRISCIHLPWSAQNAGWAFSDRFGQSSNLTATVTLDFDDRASNPFLHSYHPDHDNLDANFKNVLSQGSESYTVRRIVSLSVTPPADDFASLTATGQSYIGNYSETIRIIGLARAGGENDTQTFELRGAFVLHRITTIPTLTLVP